MEIRKAVKEDAEGIIALLYQVNQVHADGRSDLFKSGGIKYTIDDLAQKFEKEDEIIYVAVEDGKVLGYIFAVTEYTKETTSLYPHKTLYIDDLCVDEKERGKHVAKSLYEYVKDVAKKDGYYHITLHVWECNPTAKLFYEAMGMQPMYTSMEAIL